MPTIVSLFRYKLPWVRETSTYNSRPIYGMIKLNLYINQIIGILYQLYHRAIYPNTINRNINISQIKIISPGLLNDNIISDS